MESVSNINPNIFIVDRSRIENRFDAQFYKYSFDYTGFIKLSKIAKVSGGKRLPLGLDFSDEPTIYRYLRVGDINWDGSLNDKNFKYLSKNVYNILKRYEIFKNELLIAIVGATIGKVSILDIQTTENIILTENCAKISITDNSVLPEFLFIILQSPIVQKQIQLNFIQTTLPKLGLDRVASLMLPPIPSVLIQKRIISLYQSAYLEKQKKESQAKELLTSIDDFILTELGITLPENLTGLENRIFLSNYSDVVGLRLDPLYFKNSVKIESNKYENNSLKKIAAIKKGQSITKEKISEGDYPVIAGGQSSPYSHSEYNFEGNVITVSASGAYSGFVWYHDYKIFASDCIVLFSKDEKQISTKFIFHVMKALQQEIYKHQQGAGQPHVYARDLEKILIPTPSPAKQTEMLKHIIAIQEKIKSLQAEAISVLENAKQEVEKMILG